MDVRDVDNAKGELLKQIEHVNTSGYKASNPISEAAIILSLGNSSEPLQNLVGQIVGLDANFLTGEVTCPRIFGPSIS